MGLIESIAERIAQIESELRNSLAQAAALREQAGLADSQCRRQEGALMEVRSLLERLQRAASGDPSIESGE